MKKEELEKLNVDELLDVANAMKIAYPRDYDKDKLVQILTTVPENSNDEYVANSEVGMLVAFRSQLSKVKSAKIIKKSTKDRKMLLETRYGARYVVDFKDIVWVNTTGRWPRWVFDLMKGVK